MRLTPGVPCDYGCGLAARCVVKKFVESAQSYLIILCCPEHLKRYDGKPDTWPGISQADGVGGLST